MLYTKPRIRALAAGAAASLVSLLLVAPAPAGAAPTRAARSRAADAPAPSPVDALRAAARLGDGPGRKATSASPGGIHASSVTGWLALTDPTGDAGDSRADITRFSATVTGSTIRVGVTLATATNPYSDALWSANQASVVVYVDRDGNGTVDDAAVMTGAGDGTLLSGVLDGNGNLACLADATWSGATYAIEFPTACVGVTSSVWLGVGASYGYATDDAPDGAVAGPVVPMAATTPSAGALTVDGWGGLHFAGVGNARSAPRITGAPYWTGWDIARDVAVTPDGGHGFVLDGWGDLHGFGLNGNVAWPGFEDGPYWPGWDIARGAAISADGRGAYVLDGWGGLHPASFGTGVAQPVGGPYWPNWDIARAVALLPDGSGGYVLDGWGGLHPFAFAGHAMPPAITSGPYWPGWDIARGVTLLPDGGGYIVDGWGGLHPFSVAGRSPAAASGASYWPGWDIARGVTALPGLVAIP